jgi:hypothetical protein
MSDVTLTDEMINEALLRAEKAICPPGDKRCYGLPYPVDYALGEMRPDGWCPIGWVNADSGRQAWTAWYQTSPRHPRNWRGRSLADAGC